MPDDLFLVSRDLVVDELGNYYVGLKVTDKEITLIHAVVYYASNQLFSSDYCQKHKHEVLTHPATEQLKIKIEKLKTGEWRGNLYLLDDLQKKYPKHKIIVDSFYDRDPKVKVN